MGPVPRAPQHRASVGCALGASVPSRADGRDPHRPGALQTDRVPIPLEGTLAHYVMRQQACDKLKHVSHGIIAKVLTGSRAVLPLSQGSHKPRP